MARLRHWLTALLALTGLATQARTPEPADARSLTIYQIMVASFSHSPDGAPGYTAMWGPDGHTKNGNLQGIIESLDYIRSLGANAIWLTPVFDSSRAMGGEKLQATGYFTNDYFNIDPHFGTNDDMQRLVDEAHARGLYVLLDGVFGHHGGVTTPSPSGYTLDCTVTGNDRNEGTGNISYPGSLDYIKEVATGWINRCGIDGWRLDQAYQACQNGHNYWQEIRSAVEDTCRARAARGEQWGTLGYMVGEDWGDAATINNGVYRNHGLISAFDFDGKTLVSGAMQDPTDAGMHNGWDDIVALYRPPRARGYLDNTVMPNMFLSNHDGYRLADRFDPADPLYAEKQMTRLAILAAYSGPVTLYFGDEWGDRSLETTGGQPDNIARTSGHLQPLDDTQRRINEYARMVFNLRRDNPAMWRGTTTATKQTIGPANVLEILKTDPVTGQRVLIIFSDAPTTVPVHGYGPVDADAWRPEFVILPPQQ